jgi:putative endonuclease
VDARHEAGHDGVWREGSAIRRHTAVAGNSAACFTHHMGGFVYIVTNRRDGILYTGVTSDLPKRAYQHRTGSIAGFTKRYGLKRLMRFEAHDDIRAAIQKEKAIKHWPRAWNVRLVHAFNPDWDDLYETIL